jgi:hypothetical protein
MVFSNITGFADLFTNPLIIWGIFVLGLFVWGIVTAATLYHWRKYRVNQSHGYGLSSVYWLGSSALIILAIASLSTHLYV